MELVKKHTLNTLTKKIIGRKVRFKSDCEIFPNFDVTGRVTGISYSNSEIIIKCLTEKGKALTIGSNMKNLRFELL